MGWTNATFLPSAPVRIEPEIVSPSCSQVATAASILSTGNATWCRPCPRPERNRARELPSCSGSRSSSRVRPAPPRKTTRTPSESTVSSSILIETEHRIHGQGPVNLLHGDAHVIHLSVHDCPPGLQDPKTARSLSDISPTVAPAEQAATTAFVIDPSPLARRSRRRNAAGPPREYQRTEAR